MEDLFGARTSVRARTQEPCLYGWRKANNSAQVILRRKVSQGERWVKVCVSSVIVVSSMLQCADFDNPADEFISQNNVPNVEKFRKNMLKSESYFSP